MRSNIISPQSPCTLGFAFKALVRFTASLPIFSVFSIKPLMACSMDSLYWVLVIRLSSTDLPNLSIFSFNGVSTASSCSLLVVLRELDLSSNIWLAKFWNSFFKSSVFTRISSSERLYCSFISLNAFRSVSKPLSIVSICLAVFSCSAFISKA